MIHFIHCIQHAYIIGLKKKQKLTCWKIHISELQKKKPNKKLHALPHKERAQAVPVRMGLLHAHIMQRLWNGQHNELCPFSHVILLASVFYTNHSSLADKGTFTAQLLCTRRQETVMAEAAAVT